MLKNFKVVLRETGEVVHRFLESGKQEAEELAEDMGFEMFLYMIIEEPPTE